MKYNPPFERWRILARSRAEVTPPRQVDDVLAEKQAPHTRRDPWRTGEFRAVLPRRRLGDEGLGIPERSASPFQEEEVRTDPTVRAGAVCVEFEQKPA